VSAPSSPTGDTDPPDVDEAVRAAAAAALREAFTRLAPQGSEAWNFTGAFNQLADRYGPDHPGVSALAAVLNAPPPGGRRGRLLQRAGRGVPDGDGAPADLEQAMTQVVEAFRWLGARVRTLEERLAREDLPLLGPAWLRPAAELGEWVAPVAAHVAGTSPGGEVWHADCGEGGLLGALRDAGVPARGVEPRGAVALVALEAGHAVTICEAGDALAEQSDGALGGLVLSGVVDRVPLHGLMALLGRARRVLAPGAPIVVVARDPAEPPSESAAGDDLLAAGGWHGEAWAVLLERAGFVPATALGPATGGAGRFAVAASVPT
jgi:hypothetical protein